ncbi:MAG: AzlD domain-containing protein [Lachnospiraceae bacterium]|nr:AzlD domain-containing protein [Lachnospiraceae bacterium]
MTPNFVLYLLTMAIVTYLVRAVPFVAFRRKVTNRYVRSFLYYIPYTVLAAMTFPAILYVTASPLPALLGTIAALFLAYRGRGLVTVSLAACGVALITNLFVHYM